MKKILSFLICILIAFSLASCNKTEIDYSLHDTDVDSSKEIVKSWLSRDVLSTTDTPLINRESVNDTGLEIFLPKDVTDSSRYAVIDLENQVYNGNNNGDNLHHDLFRSLSITYLTLYSGMDLNGVASQINQSKDVIKGMFTNIDVNPLELTTTIPNSELEGLAYVEGQNRSLAVLYMPVEVNYYLAKEGSEAAQTLHSYALVPVYYELTYAVNNELTSSNLKDNFSQINLETNGSSIIDIKKEG